MNFTVEIQWNQPFTWLKMPHALPQRCFNFFPRRLNDHLAWEKVKVSSMKSACSWYKNWCLSRTAKFEQRWITKHIAIHHLSNRVCAIIENDSEPFLKGSAIDNFFKAPAFKQNFFRKAWQRITFSKRPLWKVPFERPGYRWPFQSARFEKLPFGKAWL